MSGGRREGSKGGREEETLIDSMHAIKKTINHKHEPRSQQQRENKETRQTRNKASLILNQINEYMESRLIGGFGSSSC
jgi:spore cortex formation protein SpoVR/YcgB (stage V sporulation)